VVYVVYTCLLVSNHSRLCRPLLDKEGSSPEVIWQGVERLLSIRSTSQEGIPRSFISVIPFFRIWQCLVRIYQFKQRPIVVGARKAGAFV